MLWDGGAALDFADDIVHLFHNRSAATVLEPDKRYFDYYQRHIANPKLTQHITPLNQDIKNHQFNGRYDAMVSLFTINRLTAGELRHVLQNVKQNGLLPDGLLLMAGRFMDNYGTRADMARYFANVLFHCIAHHNLHAAQGVLADWYQADNRRGNTVMRADVFEKILTESGFNFLRYKLWPEEALLPQLPTANHNSGVYLYKAWIKHREGYENTPIKGENKALQAVNELSTHKPSPPQTP
jgi:hypothetical protein